MTPSSLSTAGPAGQDTATAKKQKKPPHSPPPSVADSSIPIVVPKMGPEPTLLSRKQVDALYETLAAVRLVLDVLHLQHGGGRVQYIITGGSLLGAVRQHSILFCDDDVDIALLEDDNSDASSSVYARVSQSLQRLLDEHFPNERFLYQVRPWEAGDRIRHGRFNNVFVDLFTIRRYDSFLDFKRVISTKANGQEQSQAYVENIMDTVQQAMARPPKEDANETTTTCTTALSMLPFWHFDTRKAIELWPKEVYREHELFPLSRQYKMGPLEDIAGPRMPILLLKRAFGHDCFDMYYQSASHENSTNTSSTSNGDCSSTLEAPPGNTRSRQQDNPNDNDCRGPQQQSTSLSTNGGESFSSQARQQQEEQQQQQQQQQHLPPHVWVAGTWQDSQKVPLQPEHYIPLQPTRRAARRPTLHNQQALKLYLQEQSRLEATWISEQLQLQQQLTIRNVGPCSNSDKKAGADDATTPPRDTAYESKANASVDNVNSHVHCRQDDVNEPTVPTTASAAQHKRQHGCDTTKRDTNNNIRQPRELQHSLQHQQQQVERTEGPPPPPPRRRRRTVYMDGVFDLLHVGHLNAIRQCAALGDEVIIGVTGDEDAAQYKRPPILSQSDRTTIVQALPEVDQVVCPCPLIVTLDFMQEHSIDLVVHGFCNEEDAERQREFFDVPMRMGRFQRIAYYHELSTTQIIEKIVFQNNNSGDNSGDNKGDNGTSAPARGEIESSSPPALSKPQWFGATVAAATENAATIPYDPFPLYLRQVMEQHISKALQKKRDSLAAIREASGYDVYNAVLTDFYASGLAREIDFNFDKSSHPVLFSFLAAMDLPPTFQLSTLHHISNTDNDNGITKDQLLYRLSQNWSSFQSVYDDFVRNVCIPRLASIMRNSLRNGSNDDDSFYYQSFPCVRIIQPEEFSIGPHADVAYGHHPCTINFYLPLTGIEGTSSLFLESRPDSQDWHPIQGEYGMLKQFAGALCTHWTTHNKTEQTRVSLDFRVVPGHLFHQLKGRQLDNYHRQGYYSRCVKDIRNSATAANIERTHDDDMSWCREGPLQPPDARNGFPWTVRDWDKFWKKAQQDSG